MPAREPLFNSRVLRQIIREERQNGLTPPPRAVTAIRHWRDQLRRGVLNRLSESSSEQTFNSEIFGSVLGYTQIGQTIEATLLPKMTGPGARGTPDFVLGRFDPSAGISEWVVVGEIKNAKTDLDQPQVGRANPETPVEQAFRYATTAKPGVEWIIVTNFREVRLYKNGYARAYHVWNLDELDDPEDFFEFYTILRPAGLLSQGRLGTAARAFLATIS